MPNKLARIYKWMSALAKWGIAIGSIYFIGIKLYAQQNLMASLGGFIGRTNSTQLTLLLLALLLVLVNWGIEAIKWQMLIKRLQNFSFKTAFLSVIAGISVSIFSPNRSLEFGGRIFYLRAENRSTGIFLSFLGNAAQLLVTIMLGMLSFKLIKAYGSPVHKYYLPDFFENGYIQAVMFMLPMAIYCLIPRFKRFHFPTIGSIKILLLSLCRYLVFCGQYFMLLKFCQVNTPIVQTLLLISLTFLLVTIIPTLGLTELGVRGSVAIAIIGQISPNTMGILSASLALWILNIAIPALVGAVLLMRSSPTITTIIPAS